jgi:hypothetical protein
MQSPIEPTKVARLDHLMTLVADTLPAYRSGEWSLLERGVFNSLLATAIQRRGAAAVTPDVLEAIQKEMAVVVCQYSSAWNGNGEVGQEASPNCRID